MNAAQMWQDARDRFESLALRERVLVILGCAGVLYAMGDSLWIHPLAVERSEIQGELKTTRERIAVLEAEAQQLAGGAGAAPESEESRLRSQLAALEGRLEERASAVLPPGEIVALLEKLLAKENSLRLVRVENRAAEPLVADAGAEGAAPKRPRLYRHALVMELEGSYLGAVRYLEAVERLPWRLFWNRLDYRVTEYPVARIILELHTVSGQEKWIDV